MEKAIYESDAKKSQAGKITAPSVFRPTNSSDKSETPEQPKKDKEQCWLTKYRFRAEADSGEGGGVVWGDKEMK